MFGLGYQELLIVGVLGLVVFVLPVMVLIVVVAACVRVLRDVKNGSRTGESGKTQDSLIVK